MRFNPWLLVFIVLAIFAFGGGRYYNGGVYQPYGIGIGGILVILFFCYLLGWIR